ASWDDTKGNGGATTAGVTASEIDVAFPVNSTAPSYPTAKPIVDFFNTRYQFYGRKIVIKPYTSQTASQDFTGTDLNDPQKETADARQTTTMGVFATLDFVDPLHYSWSLPVYRQILTSHKIISLAGGEMTPYGTQAQLVSNLPYEWSYYPTIDTLM